MWSTACEHTHTKTLQNMGKMVCVCQQLHQTSDHVICCTVMAIANRTAMAALSLTLRVQVNVRLS